MCCCCCSPCVLPPPLQTAAAVVAAVAAAAGVAAAAAAAGGPVRVPLLFSCCSLPACCSQWRLWRRCVASLAQYCAAACDAVQLEVAGAEDTVGIDE